MSGEAPKTLKSSRLRRLSGEEIELWRLVTKGVQKRADIVVPEVPASPVLASPVLASPKAVAAERILRQQKPTAASYAPPMSQQKLPAPALAPLERRLKQRLLRGRTSVDQVLDLHGLYQAAAHRRLLHFLANAQAGGARLVLVITGKGRSSAAEDYGFEPEEGVLRRQVPHWLRSPDMRRLIIGFEQAGQPHGGAGALYVRIRKFERH